MCEQRMIKRQKDEYVDISIDDINNTEHMIMVAKYDDIPLNRYWFDIEHQRVLLYMPYKKRFKVLKGSPAIINNKQYNYFGLIDEKGKSRTKNYDKFIKHLIDCLC